MVTLGKKHGYRKKKNCLFAFCNIYSNQDREVSSDCNILKKGGLYLFLILTLNLLSLFCWFA